MWPETLCSWNYNAFPSLSTLLCVRFVHLSAFLLLVGKRLSKLFKCLKNLNVFSIHSSPAALNKAKHVCLGDIKETVLQSELILREHCRALGFWYKQYDKGQRRIWREQKRVLTPTLQRVSTKIE